MNIYKCELVKEKSFDYGKVSCASDVAEIFRKVGVDRNSEEVFWIACANAKGKIIGMHEVSRGSMSSCPVHPREVFKRALLNNASSVFLCHNHPSGDPNPSMEDRSLTEKLIAAGKVMGIRVMDHVILGDEDYYSFMGNGLMGD